jgi:hypothetical protein
MTSCLAIVFAQRVWMVVRNHYVTLGGVNDLIDSFVSPLSALRFELFSHGKVALALAALSW